MKRFTQIAGLSEARRLPRIGKIRLGTKVLSRAGKEIPKELEYFLLPEPGADEAPSVREAFARFRKAYGERPREIEVVLPHEEVSVFFPQRYKCYGASGLRCVGDGVTAERIGRAMGKEGEEAGEFFEVACPTPDECDFAHAHGCRPVGSLFVILPRVSLGGCFQIDVSGVNSILNVNSAIDHIRSVCGRVAGLVVRRGDEVFVPLILKRVPTSTQGGGRTSIHYPLALELRLDLEDLPRYRGCFALGGVSTPTGRPDLAETPHPNLQRTADPEPPAPSGESLVGTAAPAAFAVEKRSIERTT